MKPEVLDSAEKQIDRNISVLDVDRAVLTDLWRYKIFKFMLVAMVVMFSWSIAATVIVSSALQYHHVPDAYGIDKYGRMLKLTPLVKSNMRNEAVGKLLGDFLEDTFTFDPVNYKSQLNKAGSLYFTPSGFTNFANEMKKPDGFLQFAIQNNAVTTAMSRGVPTLIGAKVWNGRYAWKLSVIIAIDFKGPSTRDTRYFRMTGVLSRQSIAEYEHGLAIESLVIAPISEREI